MRYILAIFFSLWASTLFAQTPVVTQPYQASSSNQSGTIAVTNTFQQVFPASGGNTGRSACTVQNNGTHTMYVFFGSIANATGGGSIVLAAGQAIYCNNGPVVLNDQVSITGTSGDAFFAAQQ